MRSVRNVMSTAAAVAVALSLIPMLPGHARAQSSQITVLVAPLVVADGVDRNFGRDVARKVRESLENFGGLTPIEEDDVEDFLDQYELDWRNLSAIEWRQIAGQMQASMVMIGTAERSGQGVSIDVAFLDPRTGDELPVEPFTVEDDGDDDAAAERITADLEVGVEYQRSLVFCNEYLASEEFEDALRNCNAALEVNPNSTRALYLRGRIYMAQEAYGTAVEDLERVIEAEPSNTDAIQSAAYTHAQLGNNERSLELYMDYLTFNPEAPEIRMQIAYELTNAGAHAEAVEVLEAGVERQPDHVDMLEYLGNIALRAGQENGEVTDAEMIRKAVAAFEKVLDIRGDQIAPTTLTNVINAYMLIEEYDQALAFSDRAITLINNPPAATSDTTGEMATELPEEAQEPARSKDELLAQVYAARANVYSRQDMHAESAAELERALELDPEVPSGYQRLGLAKLRSGDEDGAIEAFRTSVEHGANPEDIANALFGQGYNDHFQQGRYLDAIRLFDVAAEFAQTPENQRQIHFFMGFGHFQRGTNIDNANADAEACGPARQALAEFQQVLPHLNQAGQYQPESQTQIRDAVDVQLYRQEQIIRAACS